jgi:hypothetical protein
MDSIPKIIAGLLFLCILIIGLSVLFHPVDQTKEIIIPAPITKSTFVPALEIETPIVSAGENNTAISLDREWVKMNSDPDWPTQFWHCSVALWDGSIVVMGGQGGEGAADAVWRSPDHGITWTRMISPAPWKERSGQSCVALPDGSIVLMSGNGQNDVWRSTDSGATWSEMTEHANWSPRNFPSSVAMPDGSILLLGGNVDNQGNRWNDVWRSTDKGATWTQVTAHAGWSARDFRSAVALPDGSVVVMGGNGFSNDVWRSTDYGASWTRMTEDAGWTYRIGQTAVALQGGSILLMGGDDFSNLKNDTWISNDEGATWGLVNQSCGWEAREFATSVVTHDGSVVLIGGEGKKSMKNDVWVFLQSGQPVPTKQPTPAPTTIIPTPRITAIPTASEVRDANDPSLFIRMDPIQDFETDSSSSIIGPTKLNMTITTNYPEGSLFFFDIINKDSSRHLLTKVDVMPAVAGIAGLNTISYIYDMKGQPIGHYLAEVNRGNTNTTVTARFNVTPPGLWTWIWTDPVSPVYEGDTLTVTGTTTMEPGSNLTVTMQMEVHPCLPPDNIAHKERELCYNNCNSLPGPETATVAQGYPGKNTWRATFNTSGWCWEGYYFTTSVDRWINVTGNGASFRVSPPKNS